MAEYWRKCNACKKEIGFNTTYYQCSVSTCNRQRTGLVFCTATCWDSHLGEARHRDAWATDARSPSREQWQRELAAQEAADKSGPVKSASAAPTKPAPPAGAPVRPAVPVAAPQPAAGPVVRPMAGAPQSAGAPPTQQQLADTEEPAPPSPRRPPPTPDSVQPHHARPAPSPASSTSSTTMVTTAAPAARRVVVGDASPVTAAAVEGLQLAEVTDRDILIVISKLKKYIKDRSGFNCSDAVAEVLSDHVRALCDDSIRAAGRDERKTVLDRDVPRPRR